MKIIQAKGQTCNQFWIYSHYIADSFVTGEKILILTPDITINDYPNLITEAFLKYPFYSKFWINIISHKKLINFLKLVFNNKFTLSLLDKLFYIFPNIHFIEGKMQDYTSINRFGQRNNLKQIFKPTDKIINTTNNFINQKKNSFDIIVGIHIRRGDYKVWRNGEYYYSDNQYSNIMSQMEALLPNYNLGFLICSNEKIQIKKFGNNKSFILKNSSPTMDLYGLSLCDFILGPPSSYSAWAAFYGDVPLYFVENINQPIKLSQFIREDYNWPPFASSNKKYT